MKVVVYTKDNCSYCSKAKALISSKGLSYEELKVGEDLIREDFMSIFPHVKTMPFIMIDGKQIGGFNDLVEYFNNKQEFLVEG